MRDAIKNRTPWVTVVYKKNGALGKFESPTPLIRRTMK